LQEIWWVKEHLMKSHLSIAGFTILVFGILLILAGGIKLSFTRRGNGSRSASRVKKLTVPAILLGGICVVVAVLFLMGVIVP
jgi:amino acid transporter